MGVYTDDILGAAEDIDELGEKVQWIRPTSGSDPSSPWIETGADEVFQNIPVAFIPLNGRGFESLRSILGSDVPIGHDQGLIPGNAEVSPQIGDICIRSTGRRYAVLSVSQLNVNGEMVLYTITFREE